MNRLRHTDGWDGLETPHIQMIDQRYGNAYGKKDGNLSGLWNWGCRGETQHVKRTSPAEGCEEERMWGRGHGEGYIYTVGLHLGYRYAASEIT